MNCIFVCPRNGWRSPPPISLFRAVWGVWGIEYVAAVEVETRTVDPGSVGSDAPAGDASADGDVTDVEPASKFLDDL